MNPRTTLISLCLVGLAGCHFTEHFFDWLDNATLVCDDIQSRAEDCWAGVDTEEAESECEELEVQAATCTWELNGEASEASDEAEDEAEDEDCDALADYVEACWDWAETEEEEQACEELELDLEACLEGDTGSDTGEHEE